MTANIIQSNAAVAIVLDTDEARAFQLFSNMQSNDLAFVRAEGIDCLYDYSSDENCKLSAVIINADVGFDAVEAAVDRVNPSFKHDDGPILVIVDGEPGEGHALKCIRHAKLIDRNLGARALRRFLAEEIERYSIISALRRELEKRTSAIGQIVQGVFEFKTRREAQNLATMLSLTCKDPMPVAIGLTELFVNAIEHGCLEIGHDEKGQLLETGMLTDEIRKRQRMPSYKNRVATVDFKRSAGSLFFTIKDPGPGFDYTTYMAEQEAHMKKHGRGIMMAKGCFSSLSYHGCGNEVHAVHTVD